MIIARYDTSRDHLSARSWRWPILAYLERYPVLDLMTHVPGVDMFLSTDIPIVVCR